MKEKHLFGPIEIASVVLAAGLLLCLCRMPYGYYMLIRLFTTVMGVVWACAFYGESKKALMMVAIAVAIFFQPIVKITMDKESWNVIDVALAVSLCVLLAMRVTKKNNNE